MALEKKLADTDSIYCAKITHSNQSSVFISNLGDPELEVLFGIGYKTDDEIRLRLDKRNLAFNAVAHAIDGKIWYNRKTGDRWEINSDWLNQRLSSLKNAFRGEYDVFIASLNKDDRSTQRLYMKGMTSLSREDGIKVISLRDFLFSGDILVLTKLDNGDVAFEVKIPDNPIIKFEAQRNLPPNLKSVSRQLITYGAPGTGKSWRTEEETKGHTQYRTTFHPDSDYSTFVGAYKPTMKRVQRVNCIDDKAKAVHDASGAPSLQEVIVYDFVPQAFVKAYVDAWRKMDAAQGEGGAAEPVFLVIEEINRGNCAQIFGDLFQLLDRKEDGCSNYPIDADDDLKRFLADERRLGNCNAIPGEVRDGSKLILPPNLYIRATMNTSDQSLFPMDSAFKRRWEWKYVPIAKPAQAGWKDRVIVADGKVYDWWEFLEKANAQIFDTTKSADKQMGYFFVKAPDATGRIAAERFTGKVLFYLYNDVFKDYDHPTALFGDGANGTAKYEFKDFFDEQGETKEGAVATFLEQLGLTGAPLSGEPTDSTEPAAVE
ncbi:MAG: AAA family ATPase [Candidatus Spyradosoma sp.]